MEEVREFTSRLMKVFQTELIDLQKLCIEWTWTANQLGNPTNPTSPAPGVEDVEVSPDPREVVQVEIMVMVGPETKVDLGEEREDFLEEVDSRVKSLTKARQQEDLGCQGK